MTETKRRGRPPSAKSRPTEVDPEHNPGWVMGLYDDMPHFRETPKSIIPLPKNTTREEADAIRAAVEKAMAPSRRVFVRWKAAMGSPGQEQELDWPDQWSIPQPGDQVTWAERMNGIVSHIVYDLPNGRIIIQVR